MTVVAPVIARRPGLSAVDGAWFLGPAAVLGDAAVTAAIYPHAPETLRPVLGWLAVVACGFGFAGYWLIAVVAAVRLTRIGLAANARAPWWIAAGCAGLAAAVLGDTQSVSPISGATAGFAAAALAAWITGTAVLVPVLAGSLRYVARARRYRARNPPPWPPTFSTAVYALGALQAGRLTHLRPIASVATVAARATVALWFATAALYAAHLIGRYVDRVRLRDAAE